MIQDPARFALAICKLDEANAQDPNRVIVDGQERPKELLYSEHMTAWLARLAPDASEAVRLAARGQHLRRWEIPRADYPEGRRGYLQWRTRLYAFHAECAAGILREAGYDEATVARVGDLLRKHGLRTDPEMQLLEDVICVVFLDHYFSDFARRHPAEKTVEILRKTWSKMSARGREAAGGLDLPAADRLLVERALS